MVEVAIVSGVMLTSPLWIVAYDFFQSLDSSDKKTEERDNGPWWF